MYVQKRRMKKIVLVFFVVNVLIGCSETEFKNGGLFKAENSDLFYAIEVSPNLDVIKLFILNEYDSNDSQEVLNSRKTFKLFRRALIEVAGNRIILSELESDIMPSNRPVLKDFVYRNGKIYADCENLTESFHGKQMFSSCDSKHIVFSRMKK